MPQCQAAPAAACGIMRQHDAGASSYCELLVRRILAAGVRQGEKKTAA